MVVWTGRRFDTLLETYVDGARSESFLWLVLNLWRQVFFGGSITDDRDARIVRSYAELWFKSAMTLGGPAQSGAPPQDSGTAFQLCGAGVVAGSVPDNSGRKRRGPAGKVCVHVAVLPRRRLMRMLRRCGCTSVKGTPSPSWRALEADCSPLPLPHSHNLKLAAGRDTCIGFQCQPLMTWSTWRRSSTNCHKVNLLRYASIHGARAQPLQSDQAPWIRRP